MLIIYFVLVCQGACQNSGDLLLRVSTDKTSYVVGETILINVSLVNPTDRVITLTFRTSEVFDGSVWIQEVDGEFFEKIYDSADNVFLPVITSIEIEPYSSKEILPLKYSSSVLEPGTYLIKAISGSLQSEVEIEVRLQTMPEFSHLSIIPIVILFTLFFAAFRKLRLNKGIEPFTHDN